MIEWIKFKGSTEEERIQEISNDENIICFSEEGICTFSTKESTRAMLINRFSHWAPFNLPEEEKWERKARFECKNTDSTITALLKDEVRRELDNIYSILRGRDNMFNKGNTVFKKKSDQYQKLGWVYDKLDDALLYLKEVEQDVDFVLYFEESKIRECIKILESIK